MEKTLDNIKNLLEKYTPVQYANELLAKAKDKDLIACYGSVEPEPIEKTKDRAFASYLKRYAETVEVLAGFHKMGQVFALDKRDKLIFFVCSSEKGSVRLVVNYNPLNVDCFEVSTSEKHFFENKEGRYEMSLDESRLIKELETLSESQLS